MNDKTEFDRGGAVPTEARAPVHDAGQAQEVERPRGRDVKALQGLFPFLTRYSWVVAAGFFALVLASVATLVLPVAARMMLDHGFIESDVEAIGRYFLWALGACVFMGLASALRFYTVTWLGERVVTDMRRAVYDHLLSLSPSFFEVTRTGEVLSRLTTDTTLVQTVVGANVSVALRNAFLLLGGSIMMVVTSPTLAGLAALGVPAVVFPIVIIGRAVRGLSRRSQDRVADASALAGEVLGAIQTVQAATQEPRERTRFAAAVEAAFRAANQRNVVRAFLTAFVIVLISSAIVGVLWFGAHAVIKGRMTGGELGQFVLYSVMVAGSVGTLSEVWGDLLKAAGATERLLELLRIKPAVAAPADPTPFPTPAAGRIVFDDVTFRYPLRPEQTALDGFSIAVAPDEIVALVGPSGAGKSTVFQLLLRFYDPNQGHVEVDGVVLTRADPFALRSRIAIVPQDLMLFAGSIADNIRYARPEASREEIIAAAEAASAAGFIDALPKGYDTPIGERGVTLSGGQRQRIAIARAILQDAPILLLDEATSALDAESERDVQGALGGLMRGRTTLVIAHRLATVRRADRIVVMDHGRVVGEGTHDELVRRGGLYGRLAALQFSDIAAADAITAQGAERDRVAGRDV